METLTERYNAAMMDGNCELALRIEERCGLAGYPPEIVWVGLRALDAGEDAGEAIDAYTGTIPEEPAPSPAERWPITLGEDTPEESTP